MFFLPFLELVLPTILIIMDTLLTQPILKLSSTHMLTFKMMEPSPLELNLVGENTCQTVFGAMYQTSLM